MKKKIIFLDTFILSNIAKAKRAGLGDSIYLQIFEAAKKARRRDAAAFVSTHAVIDEIRQAEHQNTEMRDVVNHTAWGLETRSLSDVLARHLVKCAVADAKGQPVPPVGMEDVFETDPHAPADSRAEEFMGSSILLAISEELDPQGVRDRNAENLRRAEDFERLRLRNIKNGVSFGEVYANEAYARTAWHYLFAPFGVAYAEAIPRGTPMIDRLRRTPLVRESAFAESDGILHYANAAGLDANKLFVYLTCMAAREHPVVKTEAWLMASVLTNASRSFEYGDLRDIQNAALLLPVCDVFTCDKRTGYALRERRGGFSLLDQFPQCRIVTGKEGDLKALLATIEAA